MGYEKVLKGASLLTVATAVGGLLSLARVVLVARLLGVVGYGTFTLVSSLTALAASLVLPSFASAIQTYYPRFAGDGREKAAKFVTATTWLTLAVSAVAVILLLFFGEFLARDFYQAPLLLPFLGIAAWYVILNPVNGNLEAFLLSMERFKAYAFLSILYPLLYLASAAWALWNGWGVAGVLMSLALSQAVLLAANVFLLWKHLRLAACGVPFKVIRFWAPVGGIETLKALQANLPTLVIGKLLGMEAVGLYGVARKTADIIPSLLSPYANTLNVVALNTFTKSAKAFNHLVNTGVKHVSILSLYAGGVLVLASRPLLAFFYGESFLGANELMQWVVYAIAFMAPNFIYKTVLLARNAPREFALGSLAGVLANLALLIGLTSWLGLAGLAYSQMAYALATLAIILLFMAKVKQPFIVGNLLKPAALSLAALLVVGTQAGTAWEAALKAGVFSILYWVVVFGLDLTSARELMALLRKHGQKMRHLASWRPENGSGPLA